jgi:hypothetical protein
VIDEAFAHEDARLEQACARRWSRDLGRRSGRVDRRYHEERYLRGKVAPGRKRVELGAASSVAYLEWSAPPDADPEDPATWLACMPALLAGPPCRCGPAGQGRHTVFIPTIRPELKGMDLAEFRRAYLNQWPDDIPNGAATPGPGSPPRTHAVTR